MITKVKINYTKFKDEMLPVFTKKSGEYLFMSLAKELHWTKLYLQSEISMRISLFARWVSHVGDGYLYTLITILFIINGMSEITYSLMFAYSFGLLTVILVKHKTRRNRPFNEDKDIIPFKIPIDKYSFPSGHSLMAFLTASVIASFYPLWGITVYIVSLLIGLSRFALGVHYITDVFCGAIIGYVIGKVAVVFFM